MRIRVPAVLMLNAVLVPTALLGTACGGDDVFPRDQFVKQVTAGGVTRDVAECTYDNIKADKAIMADLIKADGPNDSISARTDEKMSRIIARCLLAIDRDASGTTTTAPKTTTTTKRKN